MATTQFSEHSVQDNFIILILEKTNTHFERVKFYNHN